jgi:uncharacterized RDD family membrane protein YckC
VSDYPWHAAPAPAPVQLRAPAIQGRPAGVVTRSLANVVDVLVVALLLLAGYFGVTAARFLLDPTGFTLPSPSGRLVLLLGLGLLAVYYAVTWSIVGGTYGNRLLGLRVVGPDGERPHWGRSAVRAVLSVLLPIGLLWAAVSQDNRSVQDLLVRTSVVYDWSTA